MKILPKNESKTKTSRQKKAKRIHFWWRQLAGNVIRKFFRQKYDTKWKLGSTKKKRQLPEIVKTEFFKKHFFLFLMPLKDDQVSAKT